MRQKVFIFIALIFLAALLVGLNAASYVEKEKTPDDEFYPNRSTYNAGATGTRALFELLAETGRRPVRWQESPSALPIVSSANNKNNPSTFVVVGQTRRQFADKEIEQLLHWVSLGGRLVIIDRRPPEDLIATTANWKISVAESPPAPVEIDPTDRFGIDPSNQQQMTAKTIAAKTVQPSVFTAQINAVQPSRLAANILFERLSDEEIKTKNKNNKGIFSAPPPPPEPMPKPTNSNRQYGNDSGQGSGSSSMLPPVAKTTTDEDEDLDEASESSAPVVYLTGEGKNLLVDFPFGAGQIVFLSDPYIVSNGGVNLVDNARLAVNILAAGGSGTIAFDEYHQGFGANSNRIFDYFAGTPVVAIFAQAAILLGLLFLVQSRRFARPLPEVEPNRLSKLEYVSAMAELQQRAKAFDLAIENIYTDFRRRASRFLVADNYTISVGELAKLISERIDSSAVEIENLMRQCEEIMRGEPTNKREVLQITSRLREIEKRLGLRRRK